MVIEEDIHMYEGMNHYYFIVHYMCDVGARVCTYENIFYCKSKSELYVFD